MPKKSAGRASERIGRPPIADPMNQRSMVRYSERDLETFDAEVARLTERTGQRWTISGYLRVAGLAYAGKHLA